jgi:clan AA aspartic protease
MKVSFLVDTGASGTAIPRRVAEELGLQCVGEGVIEFADGRRVKTEIAYVYLKINSDHVFALVSYNGCKTPLLGFDVMHLLGLQLDTSKKQLLKPVRRFSLVNFILGKGWIGARKRKHA